jgi:hypothetical protein
MSSSLHMTAGDKNRSGQFGNSVNKIVHTKSKVWFAYNCVQICLASIDEGISIGQTEKLVYRHRLACPQSSSMPKSYNHQKTGHRRWKVKICNYAEPCKQKNNNVISFLPTVSFNPLAAHSIECVIFEITTCIPNYIHFRYQSERIFI